MKTSRVDPIVSPGQLSSHVHNFVGVNGVDANTTTVEALDEASSCTTAILTDDKSSYWAPQLYTYNTNGTFSPVLLSFVNTYYLMRGNTDITAFPRGLKMVAGNAKATGPAATKQLQDAVSFVCLDYTSGSKRTGSFPQTVCPQGLRTQIVFPSCWNGKSMYEKDMSHVVYPKGNAANSGTCPDSHAIRLPTLFYEFIWNVGKTNNLDNSSWVLANGDALGYSFHADFFANWNETTLQAAIDECSGPLNGNIEKCPPLARSINRKAASACRGQSTEPLTGALAYLPGCNIVYNGPNAGRGLAPGCDPSKVSNMPAGGIASGKSTGSNVAARSNAIAKLQATRSSNRMYTISANISDSVTQAESHSKAKRYNGTSNRKRQHATRLPNSH
ncbi:hypothetical protein PHSY_003584 [Pseudozyma hubeiensis SY62]|uniref:DUF1996 domain-containing protein n=1 Tax=Pseudozyma hubeiensis (strain SY62) TaxID=1305764 RepID=R9PD40_PSEHS|nr:hypothetical protein PHSY_003584 [Pseudozyma hubeiensis SY62]GAC96005.1 hypothetical protein PHSY_003584 [Pseudozyma hubeiensis SY62]